MTALQPLFARHETFHPRVGWLTKAVAAAGADPWVFSREDAPIRLGVGKNMVRAIRYWGLATKVLVEDPAHSEARMVPVSPTRIGHLLLGPEGVDRYIEDPRTLWLLHWYMLRPPVFAPVWWWFFEEFDAIEFDGLEVESFIRDCVLEVGWEAPASSSISKDVDCLLRMYGRRGAASRGEGLDSPFAALGLVEAAPSAPRRWRISPPRRDTLESSLIAFASLDAMVLWEPTARSVSLARLAAAHGGPGRAFRIPEASIASALRDVAHRHPGLSVASPAGLSQLIVRDDPHALAWAILADAYDHPAAAGWPRHDLFGALVASEGVTHAA